jgi:hypothetical protein
MWQIPSPQTQSSLRVSSVFLVYPVSLYHLCLFSSRGPDFNRFNADGTKYWLLHIGACPSWAEVLVSQNTISCVSLGPRRPPIASLPDTKLMALHAVGAMPPRAVTGSFGFIRASPLQVAFNNPVILFEMFRYSSE